MSFRIGFGVPYPPTAFPQGVCQVSAYNENIDSVTYPIFGEEAGMSGKGFLIAIVIVFAAVAADRYYNFGHYSDGALSMLREIQRSFGF